MEENMKAARERMDAAIAHLTKEFSSMRTGRANVHILDNVKVNYYGTETPLNQLATIAAPEASLLTIAPFDPNSIGEVEKAIHRSGLGLTPSSDGKLVRLSIPPLTEERRMELAKIAAKLGEDTKTAVRNVRRDINEQFKNAEKEHEISEDSYHDYLSEVQELTDNHIKKIDALVENKKTEIMHV